jgi:2-oxoglutarate ferredoxin oxidoreductase subunit beta
MRITEMLAMLPGTRYVTRQSAETPGAVRKLKKAVRKGFENTRERKGISFIEIVGTCSSGWKLSPVKSNEWMKENMFPYYPLGTLKDE